MKDLTEVFKLRSYLTGAEVKSLYEAEADTNPYNDAEKAKVADLYYAPTSVKTANYTASSTDLVRCDTSGGTFTVILPASGSVKVLDVVGVNSDTGFGVNPLVLEAGVGTTIMGYDALNLDVGATNLIVTLQGTDWKVFDLTTPSIVAPSWSSIIGKPANVTNLDTNLALKAPLANPTFTGNSLILPNNSRINGVEHFYQSTKPTVRGDGSALVIGDRWWKTDDSTEWFWNGTYWLSTEDQVINYSTTSNISGAQILTYPFDTTKKILTVSLEIHCLTQSIHDASNRQSISWQLQKENNTQDHFAEVIFLYSVTGTTPSSTGLYQLFATSSYADMSSYIGFRFTLSRTGTAQGWLGFKATFKEVA